MDTTSGQAATERMMKANWGVFHAAIHQEKETCASQTPPCTPMTTNQTPDSALDAAWCESRSDVGARCCFLKGHAQPHATLIAADEVRAIAETRYEAGMTAGRRGALDGVVKALIPALDPAALATPTETKHMEER